MKNFQEVYKKVLVAKKGDEILIQGDKKEIVFLGRYFGKSCPDEEYLKAFFRDRTVLEIMPGSEELYFGNDPRRDVEKDMSNNKIMVDGEEFVAENDVDYQFVKQIYFGNMEDGEGECIFRDYVGNNGIWSLAIISATREKSDIFVREINSEEIG